MSSIMVGGELDPKKVAPTPADTSMQVTPNVSPKAEAVTGTTVTTEADNMLATKKVADNLATDSKIGNSPKPATTSMMVTASDYAQSASSGVGAASGWLTSTKRTTGRSLARTMNDMARQAKDAEDRKAGTGKYRKRKRRVKGKRPVAPAATPVPVPRPEPSFLAKLAWKYKQGKKSYDGMMSGIASKRAKALGAIRDVNSIMKNVQKRMKEVLRWMEVAKAQPSELKNMLNLDDFTRQFAALKKTMSGFSAILNKFAASLGFLDSTLDEASSFSDEAYDQMLDLAIAKGRADATRSIIRKSRASYIPSRMAQRMRLLAMTMRKSYTNNPTYKDILAITKVNKTMTDVITTGETYTLTYMDGNVQKTQVYQILDGENIFKISIRNDTLLSDTMGRDAGCRAQMASQLLIDVA